MDNKFFNFKEIYCNVAENFKNLNNLAAKKKNKNFKI